jgi:hypothetical protein
MPNKRKKRLLSAGNRKRDSFVDDVEEEDDDGCYERPGSEDPEMGVILLHKEKERKLRLVTLHFATISWKDYIWSMANG